MVRSQIQTVGSWADEVEKDEEEAAAITKVYENQKPNPFGTARPREVVLQERGIDWKKLDQDLREPNSSICAQKENQLKENIPASDAPTLETKHMMSQSRRNPEKREKLKHAKAEYRSKVQKGTQNHAPIYFVPPLKYPPRAFLLPNLYPATQSFESSRRNFEAIENTRVLRKSAVSVCGKERQNEDSCYKRSRRDLVIKPLPMPDRRRDAVMVDGGMRDDGYKEKSCFQGNCNSSRVGMFSAFEKTVGDKIKGETAGQSFPGKCVRNSMETIVRGGRAETHQSKEMQSGKFSGNHKKRGINSGSKATHYHRKRK